MSNLICCRFTVGGNYNSTHDTWVDHIFVNGGLRILGRLSLDGSEWAYSDTSSDHDPLIARICFSSYVPRGDVASNHIKTSVINNRLQIQSGIIDGLDWGNAFAVFYDASSNYVGATQLIAKQDTSGKFYLADTIPIPSKAVRTDLEIEGGKTYGNIWKSY